MAERGATNPPGDPLAAIDADAPAMLARLTGWANINSGSGNSAGLIEMGSLLAPALRALGAEVEYVPLPTAEAPAVRACMRPDAPIQVLLCGHFDTVYAANDAFQTCTQPDADTLRGPGVADMKGGIVVMLAALRALEDSPHANRLGWEVLLTPDEETGSDASGPLLRDAAARHHLGIVFEPALPDGSVVASRKGVGVIHVRARGRAAHAGRDFASGRNAVVALAHFVSAAHFLNAAIPDVIVNAGSIHGGGPANVVPDHASAEFNIRAVRVDDGSEVLRRLRDVAATISAANDVSLEVTGGFTRPVMEATAASSALMDAWCGCARSLGCEIGRGHSGGGSDGNILAAAGLPCIDGAGVEGGELHSDREWMRPSSLPRRAKIAAAFLIGLASGVITAPGRPAP